MRMLNIKFTFIRMNFAVCSICLGLPTKFCGLCGFVFTFLVCFSRLPHKLCYVLWDCWYPRKLMYSWILATVITRAVKWIKVFCCFNFWGSQYNWHTKCASQAFRTLWNLPKKPPSTSNVDFSAGLWIVWWRNRVLLTFCLCAHVGLPTQTSFELHNSVLPSNNKD